MTVAKLIFAVLVLASLCLPAHAVRPDEILADPQLEARAREISSELRCYVCQNQSIDDSDADLARDLRILVRERILAGDTDEAVTDYIVQRYGEFVLLKPRFGYHTALLWGAPLLILVAGSIGLFMMRRREAATTALLSEEEERKLQAILRDS
ncbi:cytochrome c-type biogenesis protein [Tianweitania sediminis]|uniref:Cytochrome c-type biogenesis protein n=1 Tax=Tianweitania sediminis TaxID=1502156 RepID=A0A8J7R253_9HYPH|nr:cytochrome c-type biogenesis protein [Tianweitania sediminis]MBP0438916.1 cytochrome c-type biogenesis protein CcmH [Tianweitania sediminis]HEV7416639.1 cytochrome c-type biogenesis protein [Tianweitania sediminis]